MAKAANKAYIILQENQRQSFDRKRDAQRQARYLDQVS
jgi:hypothetical protein